ncbi:unnamed protein product [Acanthoscelides obtectus]|uniref:Peptidase S1 domain-containing protein n=2 Tax=Acanthoscelides obtectus TaxID=200917 RepID=A0A9P0PU10_ACAOB|nr:unnamed protein product [Acanthoscelides obtectus]CAK1660818.1 hypothetical protein AOBTE_LOCUS22276 [Acanthoscelides obtectus]
MSFKMRAIWFCVVVTFTFVESSSQIGSLRGYFSTKPEVRIINGEVCKPHCMPYIVGINLEMPYGSDFCSGSLISPNYVLTAAHCLDTALKAEVIFGAHNITANEPTQVRQMVATDNFIIHPGWGNDGQLTHDLALIKLHQPVAENEYIKIVELASGTDRYVSSIGRIAGWGMTSNEQTVVTAVLRYVDGTIMSKKACRLVDSSYRRIIRDTHLCLSGSSSRGNIGTCGGDSGGPLAVDGVQVGIVSFGTSQCGIGKPSVFTRVSSYADWITSNSDVAINK